MKIHKQGLAVLAGVMLSGSVALAAPMAYVPNEKSGTVSVIDTATDTVVAEIKAGSKPRDWPSVPTGSDSSSATSRTARFWSSTWKSAPWSARWTWANRRRA